MIRVPKYIALALIGSTITTVSFAQEVRKIGAVTHLEIPVESKQTISYVDFANARAMPLPKPNVAPPTQADALLRTPTLGAPGSWAFRLSRSWTDGSKSRIVSLGTPPDPASRLAMA